MVVVNNEGILYKRNESYAPILKKSEIAQNTNLLVFFYFEIFGVQAPFTTVDLLLLPLPLLRLCVGRDSGLTKSDELRLSTL